MNFSRIFIIVLDSFGIGNAPDAAAFKYFSLVSSLGEPSGLQSQPSIG